MGTEKIINAFCLVSSVCSSFVTYSHVKLHRLGDHSLVVEKFRSNTWNICVWRVHIAPSPYTDLVLASEWNIV